MVRLKGMVCEKKDHLTCPKIPSYGTATVRHKYIPAVFGTGSSLGDQQLQPKDSVESSLERALKSLLFYDAIARDN